MGTTKKIRRKSRPVKVGNVTIGGNAPIVVQSMAKTETKDVKQIVEQILRLQDAGCEIVRIAIPDIDSVRVIPQIKQRINIPLVADIHYDYRLAIESMKEGIDKIRINPGNIRDLKKIKIIVNAAKERKIPIRIGVNSGSVMFHKEGKIRNLAGEMVKSALNYIRYIEKLGFYDMVISLKSPDILTTIRAYRMIAEKIDYPLHIGITESGPPQTGIVRSSIGTGMLLYEGIGDTIRVSLTSDPVLEVKIAYEILKSLQLREKGVTIISCPTCGRCEIDIIKIVNEIERKTKNIDKNISVAIMGCSVNGPGEARDVDIGIAGGKRSGLLFKKGKIVKKVEERYIITELITEIGKL